MKKKVFNFLIVVVVLIGAAVAGNAIGKVIYQARYFSSLPEYEIPADIKTAHYCPLCERVPSNGPLIVNTNLGLVGELQIFDTELRDRLTISEKRDYGIMRSGGAGGAHYYAFPDNCYADVSIQRQYLFKYSRKAAEHFFCAECVANFDLVEPECNYVVVDGYDRDNLKYFCLRDIEKTALTIRHYSFAFDEKNEYRFDFKVVSNYFEGGRELDYLNE